MLQRIIYFAGGNENRPIVCPSHHREKTMAPAARILGALLFPVAASATLLAHGQTVLEPGLWRITVNSTTNGKPDPAQDNQECLGAELKDLGKYFAPEMEGVRAKCTRTAFRSNDPNTLSHRMTCTGTHAKFTTEIQSKVNIMSATHFKLHLKLDTKTPKESAIVIAEGEAKRIGACPKS